MLIFWIFSSILFVFACWAGSTSVYIASIVAVIVASRAVRLGKRKPEYMRKCEGYEEYFARADETEMWPAWFSVACVLKVPEGLSSSRLRAALVALQERQPLWKSSIVKDKDTADYWFQILDKYEEKIKIEDFTHRLYSKADVEWYMEEFINSFHRLKADQLMWSAALFKEADDRFHVVIWQSHVICDGCTTMQMTSDLIKALSGQSLPPLSPVYLRTGILSQVYQTENWKSLPAFRRWIPSIVFGLLDFYKEWLPTALQAATGETWTVPIESGATYSSRRGVWINGKMNKSDFAEFLGSARQHGVTLSAAFMAAAAVATAKCSGMKPGDKMTMLIPMNLRPRVANEGFDEYICGIVSASAQLLLPESFESQEAFWIFASQIHEQNLRPSSIMDRIAEATFALDVDNALLKRIPDAVKQRYLADPAAIGPLLVSSFGCFNEPKYVSRTDTVRLEDMYFYHSTGCQSSFPDMICVTYNDTFYYGFDFPEPLLSRARAADIITTIKDIALNCSRSESTSACN
jgi:hypothetical protein